MQNKILVKNPVAMKPMTRFVVEVVVVTPDDGTTM
jgi:hypothetical protein